MTNITPITSFTGEYRFLSNFDTSKFLLRGQQQPSGEHAFVWGKLRFLTHPSKHDTLEDELFERCPRPQDARNLGKRIEIDSKEWDKHSMWWMRELVHAKFSTAKDDYVGRLINTGAAMLVEGNTWGDKIWGRVNEGGTWKGLNLLGAILMEERGYWLHTNFGGWER